MTISTEHTKYDVEVVVTRLVTIATDIVTIATRVKRLILAKIVTFSIEMRVLLVINIIMAII